MSIIQIDELTKSEIDGTGIFDECMRSVKAHLQEELAEDRITPINYSSVYLGALQATMKMSLEFLLSREKVDVDLRLSEQNLENAKVEKALLEQKLELGMYAVQNAKYEECNLSIRNAQSEAQLQSTLQATANAKTQAQILTAQYDKLQNEILLYKQKIRSEQAQIHDLVEGVPVTGIVGTQRDMYRKQANGYLRHAEQQAARIMSDLYTIRFTEDKVSANPANNYCNDAEVSAALKALLDGVELNSKEGEQLVRDTTPVGTMPPINMAPALAPELPVTPPSCTANAIET
jgi:hypothetical protein